MERKVITMTTAFYIYNVFFDVNNYATVYMLSTEPVEFATITNDYASQCEKNNVAFNTEDFLTFIDAKAKDRIVPVYTSIDLTQSEEIPDIPVKK